MKSFKHTLGVFMSDCLKVREKEVVLIISDNVTQKLGKEFFKAAIEKNAEAVYLEILERDADEDKLPEIISTIMQSAKAIVSLTNKSLAATSARQQATQKGVRIACFSETTKEVITRTLSVDYNEIALTTQKLADIFTIGKKITVTTPAGTNLQLSISRRKGVANTSLVDQPGSFSEFPAGKAVIAPIEGKSEGIIIVDGSIKNIGLIKEPMKMIVKEGFVTRIYGKRKAKTLSKHLQPFGLPARNVAEFGIGTNHNAKLTGIASEDEKVLSTAHIAIGENISIGGKIDAPIHLDMIFLNPTVVIDGKTIMGDGELKI